MPYIALYRKYRSQTFEDVLGQEHVTRTIQNAIAAGKVGHAYLFCGSRGTGKTTVARLIAKAVNCEKGPTGHPCNECAACRAITEGSAVDVLEMDAASHRGVQDVDSLREGVKYPPMHLRYKVYIIDEAHQLSAQAKDAFLKTLEEPPDHAIFILATTEAHAIPPTIRSRCQQFDFRRGTLESISERLRYVASGEGVKLDDDAVRLLAEAASGSWRDALSMLEQVMAYSGETVTADDVVNVLGTVGQEVLREVTDVIAGRDAAAAFGVGDRLMAEGKDIGQLLKSLAAHFRDVLFAASGASDAASGRFGPADLKEQASEFEKSELLRIIEVFSEAERELRWNDQQRLVLEMALLKAIEEPARSAVVHQVRESAQPAAKPVASERTSSPEEPPKAEDPLLIETPANQLAESAVGANGLTVHDIRKAWGQVLSAIRTGKNTMPVYALLREARPFRLEGDVFTLAYDPKWKIHSGRLQEAGNRSVVESALAAVVGARLRVKTVLQATQEDAPPATAAEPLDEPIQQAQDEAFRQVQDVESDLGEQGPFSENADAGGTSGDELLQEVIDVFGGSVVEDNAETDPWEDN